jgi:hypothetical protein
MLAKTNKLKPQAKKKKKKKKKKDRKTCNNKSIFGKQSKEKYEGKRTIQRDVALFQKRGTQHIFGVCECVCVCACVCVCVYVCVCACVREEAGVGVRVGVDMGLAWKQNPTRTQAKHTPKAH